MANLTTKYAAEIYDFRVSQETNHSYSFNLILIFRLLSTLIWSFVASQFVGPLKKLP